MRMPTFLLFIACAASSLAGSEILFDSDFNQLPDGWVTDPDWGFGSFGAALCVSIDDDSWTGDLSTEGEPPERILVPAGTDSVVIEVDQWVFLSADQIDCRPVSTAMIQLWTDYTG